MAHSSYARRLLGGIGRRIREQKGFSLTEVVISLAILGVVGTSVMFGLSNSNKTILNAHEKTVAESLSRMIIEAVKRAPYDVNDPPRYSLDGVVDLDTDPYYLEYEIGPTVVIYNPTLGHDVTYLVAERLDPHADGLGNDDGVQKITVGVKYQGKVAMTTEDYKVDR